MSDIVLVALIASTPPTIAAIAALISARKAHSQSVQNSADIKIVARETNGMKDELIRVTKSEAFAAGEKSEKDKKP